MELKNQRRGMQSSHYTNSQFSMTELTPFNTLTPHAGLIPTRILNFFVVKYASVLSIQAHDEPNSNIIRTLMFRKTLFTKVITPQKDEEIKH